jgi:hypothetical protein
MDLHFVVRLLVILVALACILVPMFRARVLVPPEKPRAAKI